MTCGIYCWEVTRPDGSLLLYVGQSRNIEVRRRQYVHRWRHNLDTNQHLKAAVLKYGPSAVRFLVLEVVAPERLNEREQYWLDWAVAEFGADNVANKVLKVDDFTSNEATFHRRRTDPVWRENQRQAAIAARAKRYTGAVAPDGAVYRDIYNLSEFCRHHGLNISKMAAVMRGERNHHRGWSALKEE